MKRAGRNWIRRRLGPLLDRPGWTATITGSSHIRLTYRTGAVVFCSGSPGDWRDTRNVLSQMRRAERDGLGQTEPSGDGSSGSRQRD